ncbi:MAG: hypothetical protein Q8934_05890 [Bacillota bacterium]|nr:hypothetical protein [Bacillota bacterium]
MNDEQQWEKENIDAYSVDDEWEKIKNKGNSMSEDLKPEFDFYGTALNEL